MKLKNCILTSLLSISMFSNLYGNSDKKQEQYENTYLTMYMKLSGLDTNSLEKFINEDNFKIASEYLFNPNKQEIRKVNHADIHDLNAPAEFKVVKVPNLNEVMKYLSKSAENGNPISAYTGSYIIQNFTSMQDENNLKLFKMFSDVLYSQEIKICNAYLQQGEVFENGYFTEKSERKALSVYKEGLRDKNCNFAWTIAVLNSKINKLEKIK